jgi:hypothetical protein
VYRKTNQRATIFAKLEAQQSCNFAVYDSPTSVMETVVKINCLRKIKEERKRSNTQIKNTRIYVVRQYAYIHRRRQGESFTKKIGRLQQWYQNSLKEPKPQLHPNLSLTKNKPRETLL